MKNADVAKRRDEAISRGVGMQTQIYADRALNSEVWDIEGNRYLDFAAGIAVVTTSARRVVGELLLVLHEGLPGHEPGMVVTDEHLPVAQSLGAAHDDDLAVTQRRLFRAATVRVGTSVDWVPVHFLDARWMGQ